MEIHQISNFTYTDSHSNPSSLESKIRYLEEKMVQLQLELAAEKQYLDSERAQASLWNPGNAQSQGHLSESSSIRMVDPLCPVHGSSSRISSCPGLNKQEGDTRQENSSFERREGEGGGQRHPPADGPTRNYPYETPPSARLVYHNDLPFRIFEKEVDNTDAINSYPSTSYFEDELRDASLGSFRQEEREELAPVDDLEDNLELDGVDYLERLLELDELCKEEMARVNEAAGSLRPLNQLASDWEVEKLEAVLANGGDSAAHPPLHYKDVFEDLHPLLANEPPSPPTQTPLNSPASDQEQ